MKTKKIIKVIIGDFSIENKLSSLAVTILIINRLLIQHTLLQNIFHSIGYVLMAIAMYFAYKNPEKKERTKSVFIGLISFSLGVALMYLLLYK